MIFTIRSAEKMGIASWFYNSTGSRKFPDRVTRPGREHPAAHICFLHVSSIQFSGKPAIIARAEPPHPPAGYAEPTPYQPEKQSVTTLREINLLTPDAAKEFFLACCGSTRWAENMAACRPFWSVHVVRNAAETIWKFLTPEDQREALRFRSSLSPGAGSEPPGGEPDPDGDEFGYRFLSDPHLSGGEEMPGGVHRRFGADPDDGFDTAVTAELGRMMDELAKRIAP
jgi:hypothetical protein